METGHDFHTVNPSVDLANQLESEETRLANEHLQNKSRFQDPPLQASKQLTPKDDTAIKTQVSTKEPKMLTTVPTADRNSPYFFFQLVREILMWRDPYRSAAVFGFCLGALILDGYYQLPVAWYAAMLIPLSSGVNYVMALLGKENLTFEIYSEIADRKFFSDPVMKERMSDAVQIAADEIAKILLCRNPVHSALAFVILFLAPYVYGVSIYWMTLLGTLLAFTLPPLYARENVKRAVDQQVDLLSHQGKDALLHMQSNVGVYASKTKVQLEEFASKATVQGKEILEKSWERVAELASPRKQGPIKKEQAPIKKEQAPIKKEQAPIKKELAPMKKEE